MNSTGKILEQHDRVDPSEKDVWKLLEKQNLRDQWPQGKHQEVYETALKHHFTWKSDIQRLLCTPHLKWNWKYRIIPPGTLNMF